jgi:hypothetical protein
MPPVSTQIPLPRKILVRDAALTILIGVSGLLGLGINAVTRPGWGPVILTLVLSALPAVILLRLREISRRGLIVTSSRGLRIRGYLTQGDRIPWGGIAAIAPSGAGLRIVYEPHLGAASLSRELPPLEPMAVDELLRAISAYRPDCVAAYLNARGQTATWEPVAEVSLPTEAEIPRDRFEAGDFGLAFGLIGMVVIMTIGMMYPRHELNVGQYIAFGLIVLILAPLIALMIVTFRSKWRDPGGPEFHFGRRGIRIRIAPEVMSRHYEWSAVRSIALTTPHRKNPRAARCLLLDVGERIPFTIRPRGGVTLFDIVPVILRHRPDLTLVTR